MYLKKNTASQVVCVGLVNASTGSALTGATVTVRRCIDGTFAATTGSVTEDTGLGFYKFAASQADTNGDQISYFFTATSAIPVTLNVRTTAADMSDTVRFGLTALPNAAAGANTGLPVVGTQIPNATAGASGGMFIAGTNAATTVTTSFTTTFTGNLTGSVGSVTGAVGSVTGNVGGNVTGSVGSISGVTFPTNFSTLGINASGHVSRVTLADTITTYTGNTVQTGDSFARIGATGSGLTSLATAASVAAVETDTQDIQGRLPAALTNGLMSSQLADGVTHGGTTAKLWLGSSDAFTPALYAVNSATDGRAVQFAAASGDPVYVTGKRGVIVEASNYAPLYLSATTTGFVGIQAVTTGGTNPLSTNIAAQIQSGLSTITTAQVNAECDTALADVGVTTIVTGRIDAAVTSRPTLAQILAGGDIDGYTLEEAHKLILAALAGKLSGAATSTVTIRSADDTVNRVVATVDSSGNRTAITLDATG